MAHIGELAFDLVVKKIFFVWKIADSKPKNDNLS